MSGQHGSKKNCGTILWLMLVLLVQNSAGFEPISIITAVGASITATIMAAYKPVKCRFFAECCTDRHIGLNETVLRLSLSTQVYGQHLCKSAVINHLRAHARSTNPTKALALSFHGGTGTGKNLVSRIVAESMYRKGMRSKYVHLISATKEFPHLEMVPIYKDKLKEKIESSVAECERSLFIFDEVDKMPSGLLDIVKPYLDFYEELGGVDYRKTTFIFLSNTAGKAIVAKTLDHWRQGKVREDITLVDMEKLVSTEAVNTRNSGLWHSELLLAHMISAHLPFLPLERKHVRDCIKDSLVAKKYYRDRDQIEDRIVREIADQLPYFPKDEELYSVTGCKRVPEKVDYIMAGYDPEV